MRTAVEWMERWQVPLYLAAFVLGAGIGLLIPAFRDWRFLVTVLTVNFVAVPIVVYVLSRIVAHDQVLLIGVLFVLLTPCVDYVIVFTGIAGGAKDRLLAAAPLLMLAQMLLLPLYLWLFVGAEFVATVDFAPFIEAFLLLIALPLVAAGFTQLAAAGTRWGVAIQGTVLGAMVPLMMLSLAVVVASQIAGVGRQLGALLLAIPVYILFAAVMVPIGAAAGKVARIDVPGRRAIVFSGATRNSLVVLPLVLALPAAFDLAPLVVVTQTLVELIVMVVFVRLIPRLLPDDIDTANSRPQIL
jgi:ACR3 family arsenite efflux pump ArsB